MTASSELPIDVVRILSLLPHRYPMVMVDRVTDLVPFESIRGHKCVSANEPWFQGHFPREPIMPGVLILEAFAQIGGILANASDETAASKSRLMYFLSVDKAKFRRVVRPGDRLDLSAVVQQHRAEVWKFRAEGHVDGVLCAEAEILTAAVERP